MSNPTITLLDEISTKLGDVSDGAVARALGVTRATVSKWRNGIGSMSDDTAIQAAKVLGKDSSYTLVLAAMERAPTEKAKAAWTNLARRLQRSTAATIVAGLGFAALLNSPPAHAAPWTAPGIYIM